MHPDATEAVARAVEDVRAAHRRIARDRSEELAHTGLHARTEERVGDAAEQIVGTAIERDVDVIVMGSRGRTGLTRVLLGSVARNVLVQAPCSVLIVRRSTRI